MKALRIWWLKRKLRRRYKAYCWYMDHALTYHFSYTARRLRDDMNETVRQLQKLDPDNAPKEIE